MESKQDIRGNIDSFYDFLKSVERSRQSQSSSIPTVLKSVESELLVIFKNLKFRGDEFKKISVSQIIELATVGQRFTDFIVDFLSSYDIIQNGKKLTDADIADKRILSTRIFDSVLEGVEPFRSVLSHGFEQSLFKVTEHVYNVFVDIREIQFETTEEFVVRISKSIERAIKIHTRDSKKQEYLWNSICEEIERSQSIVRYTKKTSKLDAPPNAEYYKTHANGRNIVQFITEVYCGYLTGQFTRADLRGIDDKAEMALRNWERSRGRIPLTELNLPTLKEFNDKRLAASDEVIDRHEKLDRQRLRVTRRQNAKRKLTP